jgi:hypothetical protein
MYLNISRVGEVMYIDVAHSPDGTVPPKVSVDAIFAPVSGNLILGTLAGEFETTQHLKAVQVIKQCDPDTTIFELAEALQIANLYRLFGHDIAFMNATNGEIIEPWSAVRECIIEPASLEFSVFKLVRLVAHSSRPREGRTHVLPFVKNLLMQGDTTITIQRPTIMLNHWQHRTMELRPQMNRRKKIPEMRFLVKSPLMFNPTTFKARAVGLRSKQGFRVVQTEVPAMKPEGETILEKPSMDTALTTDYGLPAKSAE